MRIKEIFEKNPIIAAANHKSLEEAVNSNASAIILIEGNLNKLMEPQFKSYTDKKDIFIHMDLVKGLSNDVEAIKFIKNNFNIKGIVSTKSSTLRAAKKYGLITIQRVFLIDTKSLNNAIESIKENNPDAVEMMPALTTSSIEYLKEEVKKPLILGGLLSKEEDVLGILNAGAIAISCSKSELWNINVKNR